MYYCNKIYTISTIYIYKQFNHIVKKILLKLSIIKIMFHKYINED